MRSAPLSHSSGLENNKKGFQARNIKKKLFCILKEFYPYCIKDTDKCTSQEIGKIFSKTALSSFKTTQSNAEYKECKKGGQIFKSDMPSIGEVKILLHFTMSAETLRILLVDEIFLVKSTFV
ncbi:hypothetical protein TNCT_107581 [Trichonephila clavata]|uniref:Uncharacterized protein n=1 Tax=Trichonephila clavata TaxID=2740835 RepID=A0A8X6HR19_TRICU|nr:hypothetical protein TNCT_107581 [Trichonephila clavata]